MDYIDLIKIQFSSWSIWRDKNNLENIKFPGIYIIAKFKSNLSRKVDLKDKDIIYMGETCSSLQKRLRQFNRSAFKGARGHSGGSSYRKKYNDKGENLYISIFPVFNISDNIRLLYIRYIERKMILDYALKNSNQPILNKK
jgi:hypothetical protein